jgi:hypothetical protein
MCWGLKEAEALTGTPQALLSYGGQTGDGMGLRQKMDRRWFAWSRC